MSLLRHLIDWFYYRAGYRKPHYEDEAEARITLWPESERGVRAELQQKKEGK